VRRGGWSALAVLFIGDGDEGARRAARAVGQKAANGNRQTMGL